MAAIGPTEQSHSSKTIWKLQLQHYCASIPKDNQEKLNKELDFEHDGVQVHLGQIADSMDEWEGRVAEELRLTKAEIAAITKKYPDQLDLQTRAALDKWKEKFDFKATYLNLMKAFLRAKKTSFVEAVCKVLTPSDTNGHSTTRRMLSDSSSVSDQQSFGEASLASFKLVSSFGESSIDRDNAQLFDEAMKEGTPVTLQILKMLITGVAGSGKTSTLDLLLDEDPKPTSDRQSTSCACRPVCVIPIVSDSKHALWDKLKLKEFIAHMVKIFQTSEKQSSKAVSDAALETETDSVDDTSEEASATIEELVQLMDQRSGLSTPLNQNWISVTDCGGQPQFQVVLPVFLQQTSLFVHVQKLSESLSAKPVIEYYDQGKSLSKPIQSPLSNEEHLKCAVQSVQSFRYIAESQEKTSSEVHDARKGNPSTMLFIATHKDEYEKKKDEYEKQKNATTHELGMKSSKMHEGMKGGTTRQGMKSGTTHEEMKKSGESCDKKEQSKCFETCEEKEKRMTELLWPYRREGNLNVIYCGKSMKNLLFGVNATSRGVEEKKLAKEIRTEINKRFPPGKPIPLRWFVLQLKLQEFGEINKRQIITKKECLDVARSIHLKSEEALDAALKYLDDLNIIFYYPEILPDVIFCHVQVLLDIVTKIVEHQYRLMGDTNDHTPTDGKWLNFRNSGRITEAMLKEILGDACFQPNVFTVNDLLTLFRALHIIADYNLEGPEYFMPCLLRIMEPDKVKDHIASFQSNMHLRVLHFPNGLFTGVFCFTIAILLHKTPASTTASVESATASATASDSTPTEWKLDCVRRSNTPKCLYRNIVQFIVPDCPGTVTLVDRFSFIEIIVAESPLYKYLCPLVKKTVLDSLAKATKHLHYVDNQPEEGVLCQCGEGEQHPAIIKCKKGKLWLECTDTQRSTTVPGNLKEINDIWKDEEIGSEPMELSVSDVPILETEWSDVLKYFHKVGLKHARNLGGELGLDIVTVGDMSIDDIVREFKKKAGYVLKKNEKPHTWNVLHEALLAIHQDGIADEVYREKIQCKVK